MAGMALEGLSILDVSQAISLPAGTKLLADCGAEVIKVESAVHLDPCRLASFVDSDPGKKYWERGTAYLTANPNKRSLVLALDKPRGREIFKELVKVSDVVTENFSPRVMRNFGLDYPVLKEIKEDLIMVSSSGFGHTGPWRDYVSYGYSMEPMSGISQVTSYPDRPPLRSFHAYNDWLGALYCMVLIVSALEYWRRTGKGLYVDFSQYEAGVCAVAESIMEFTMNGRVQARRGNRHSSMAPHGCYRCDRWAAIAVSSDEEWRALCRVMGNPPWTADERFSDQLNRWLNQDELDPLIEEWTRTRDCYEVMHTLQAAGGAAGAVLDNRDFPLDPHVKARDFFWVATRAETGTRPCYGSWQKLSKTPPALRMAAPTLGEYNEQILSELLGLSKQEIDDLAGENIIATAPPG